MQGHLKIPLCRRVASLSNHNLLHKLIQCREVEQIGDFSYEVLHKSQKSSASLAQKPVRCIILSNHNLI